MAQNIRLKIARWISDVRRPDDWKWNRWLKVPSNSKEDFTFDSVKITGRDADRITVHSPLLDHFLFNLNYPQIVYPEQFNRWLTRRSTKDRTSLIPLQKSFRIFISKIQAEVSKNLVPEDHSAPLLFSYKPEEPSVFSLSIFNDTDTAFPMTQEYDFTLEACFTAPFYEFRLNVPDVYPDLTARFGLPEIVSFIKFYKETVTGENLISHSAKEIITSAVDKYIFKSGFVSSNLLATSDKISTAELSFNIETEEIAPDLLSIVPETRDIALLKPGEFRIEDIKSFPVSLSSFVDNRSYFVEYDSSFINYVGKKKILVASSRVLNISFNEIKIPDVSGTINPIDLTEDRAIPFQELTSDYINHAFNFYVNGNNAEELEVKDNPVLMPRVTEYRNDKDVFDGLYQYQKEAVTFLMNNSRAFFSYDPLLDYKPQLVFSLSMLLRQGKVRSALIIRNSHLTSLSVNKEDEWISVLKKWAPEIPYDVQISNTTIKLKPVNFASYKDLKNLKLKRFDCIIADKYSNELQDALSVLNSSECPRVWIFTSDRNTETPASYNIFSTNRGQVNEDIPSRRYEYRWLQLDKKQVNEYKSLLMQGQLKIYASIDRGEIYIIKPHLFTLLHQLMQTCNFGSDEHTSAKTDALLQDINTSSGKVVVLSQYEKFGLERIEKLLRSKDIGCVSFRMGAADNERSLNDFRTKENIKVLLADVKALNSRLNTGKISTIIHFDHWWNPVSQWAIEDRLTNTNLVNIIQYCTEDTIEEDIYKKLLERELTSRLVFESLTPAVYSDILTDEEWLELYNIHTEADYPKSLLVFDMQTKIKSFSLDELVTMIQKVSVRIGYAKQKTLQHISEREIVLVASRLLNNREENVLIYINMNDNVDQSSARVFYEEYIKYKNVSKAFFITPGRIVPACSALFNYHSHKVSFFDGESLGKLLHLFNLI